MLFGGSGRGLRTIAVLVFGNWGHQNPLIIGEQRMHLWASGLQPVTEKKKENDMETEIVCWVIGLLITLSFCLPMITTVDKIMLVFHEMHMVP